MPTPKILVLYSCPANLSRIRLDKEHRALDQVLQKHQLDQACLTRVHATTIPDFARSLREDSYDIVQFSGHGSIAGFCLEDGKQNTSVIVGPSETAQIIQSALPQLRLAFFASCFSASVIDTLIHVAPFVITIEGKADDDAVIAFVGAFYDELFRTQSIERAFKAALYYVALSHQADHIRPLLSRRAAQRQGALVQACFGIDRDSVFIDLSQVQDDIGRLGITREDFLELLTRKIRLHEWIFRYERENALLSFGPYLGLFSWAVADDVITCHRIMRIRPDVEDATLAAWTTLIVAYNDLRCSEYRLAPDPAAEDNSSHLVPALGALRRVLKRFFDNDEIFAEPLRRTLPEQFRISRANAFANFVTAESAYADRDFQATVVKLELALSAIHDFVNGLTLLLTEAPRK